MTWSKRLFDLGCAAFGLLLLWPFLLVCAFLVKLEDGGPAFLRQERIGYRGRPFRIWKFRSMVRDADKMGKLITVGRDPRITRTGHWLRKFKIDELPQLINVLCGEMSLVGPRPEVARYVRLYTQEQTRVLDLWPGITDLASLKFRNESEVLARSADPERTYIDEVMPVKINLALEYASRSTIWTDFLLILSTVLSLPDLVPADEDQR